MNRLDRISTSACCMALTAACIVGTMNEASAAGQGRYLQVNLTSNVHGMAQHTDRNLVNGWGLAFFINSPFWVSDNGSGLSTIYDGGGVPQGLVVTVPPAPEQPGGTLGSPTGIVANPSIRWVVSKNGKSGPAAFIYDTADGTISGWSPGVDPQNAVIAVYNFSAHASYTGLEIVTDRNGPRLYAADAANNKIDVFGGNFQPLFSFTDPNVPKGYTTYAIHLIQGRLFVTFAGGGGGVVDIFDTGGHLMRTFASNGPGGHLVSPWGIALAPHDFGRFSNALLIGNEDDGHISAFNVMTGAFLGQLVDPNGKTITIPGLWALQFGADSPANGKADELFFTAGPNNYADGLFGKIVEQDGH
jgi:uncharacterized protein (TIGR03118 family)